MPHVDLGKARRFAAHTAHQAAVALARSQAAPYREELQAIQPRHIEVFIQNGQALMPLAVAAIRKLHPDATEETRRAILAGFPIAKLAKFSTDVVIGALRDINPGVARVLDTPAGRAWWEDQRKAYR